MLELSVAFQRLLTMMVQRKQSKCCGKPLALQSGEKMIESLEYRIANGRVRDYDAQADAHAKLINESERAQDCMDCEAFLEKGIKALSAIECFADIAREAHEEGVVDYKDSLKLQQAAELLFEMWHRRSEFAENWIAKCQRNGYDISYLVEWRASCERAQEWLERREWLKRSTNVARARFQQEPWNVAAQAGDDL